MLFLLPLLLSTTHAFHFQDMERHRRQQSQLAAENKPTGVYSRPSAAIERGSGFFVPGLEGPKVRLVGGSLLGILTVVNHQASTSNTNNWAEGLAGVYSLLVLWQAAIEYVKEERSRSVLVGSNHVAAATAMTQWQQQWSMPADPAWRDQVEWAARTYLALTAANAMLLIGPGQLVFALGPMAVDNDPAACDAVLATICESKSGRVALPMTHPAARLVGRGARTLILQRVGDDSQHLCWLVASDDLLAAFPKGDLEWLGRLALYISP